MLTEMKNSRKQGDTGMGYAIAYFTSIEKTVSLPITDSQDYDIVVDLNGILNKIQVKTTTFKSPSGKYVANLKVCGGNRSGQTIKNFNKNIVDYIFILTEEQVMYLIPSSDIDATTSITLYEKYDKYIIYFGIVQNI